MTLIIYYLENEKHQDNPTEVEMLRRRQHNTLYFKGNYTKRICKTQLKGIIKEKKEYIIKDIYQGDYGSHIRGEMLARKVRRSKILLAYLVKRCTKLC